MPGLDLNLAAAHHSYKCYLFPRYSLEEYSLNPTKLRHVLAVDRAGSVSGAAKAISITQSSVSKSVAEIESTLGYDLFVRHARGVRTTERGREFIDRLHRIFTDLDQLIEDATTGLTLRDRVFRVGVTPLATQGLLADPLLCVLGRFPEVRVHVNASPIEQARRNLQRGDVDILFGPTDLLAVEESFTVTEVIRFRIHAFVRNAHPLAGRKRVTLKQLGEYPMIIANAVEPYLRELQRFAATRGRPEYHFHIIEHFPVVAELVANLDVVGVVHEAVAARPEFREWFTTLEVGRDPEEVSFSCAYPSRAHKTELIRAFVEGAERSSRPFPTSVRVRRR